MNTHTQIGMSIRSNCSEHQPGTGIIYLWDGEAHFVNEIIILVLANPFKLYIYYDNGREPIFMNQ